MCRAGKGVEVVEVSDGIELRNGIVSVKIDINGDIASLILADGTGILREPAKLVAHIDKPGIFDAWDVTDEFLRQGVELKLLEKPKAVIEGPLVSCVEVVKGFEESKVIQRVCLYKDSPLVEIRIRLVWRNKGVLLKHWFKTTVGAEKVWFDIPFGVIERFTKMETSWEKARFEVPAVRWADVSDNEKGLAIIAPSRHGYTVKGSDIGLSLIRSPTFPNPWSDIGEFEVVYYLYPHKGDYQKAEVPKIAREAVYKPLALVVDGAVGSVSILSIEPPKAVVTAFKHSEDGKGYIIRLYNPYKEPVSISIKLGFKAKRVVETNIIELVEGTEIARNTTSFSLEIKPFENKTLLIEA